MAQTSLKVFGRQMLRLQNSRVHIKGSEKLCSTSSVRPEILQLLCTFFPSYLVPCSILNISIIESRKQLLSLTHLSECKISFLLLRV